MTNTFTLELYVCPHRWIAGFLLAGAQQRTSEEPESLLTTPDASQGLLGKATQEPGSPSYLCPSPSMHCLGLAQRFPDWVCQSTFLIPPKASRVPPRGKKKRNKMTGWSPGSPNYRSFTLSASCIQAPQTVGFGIFFKWLLSWYLTCCVDTEMPSV